MKLLLILREKIAQLLLNFSKNGNDKFVMDNQFHKESVKVADKFVKSVLFVDDEIKWGEENNLHELNAQLLTKGFAKKGKVCSFYHYAKYEEENEILTIISTCDVAVIDWRINLKPDSPDAGEEEEDVESPEGRGYYAIELLKKIINSNIHSPKTIIILTGENNGAGIFKTLVDAFPDFESDNKALFLSNSTFRISIYFKPTLKDLKLSDEVETKIVDYENLPDLLVEEFAYFSEGLISNVALESIATLKENTSKLLQEYRKDLDSAYLTHRALCPVPEDAEELVVDSLIGSIESILSCEKVARKCNIDMIKYWIDSNLIENKEILVNNAKANKLSIGKDEMKEWLKDGYRKILEKKLEEKGRILNSSKWENYGRNGLLKDTVLLFSEDDNSNHDFAILTHHKSNFYKPGYKPKLSLGTVLKTSGDESYYYLCIQPRCDSVRMEKGETRKFLFLPLETTDKDKRFSIIFKNKNGKYIKFKIKNHSYNLTTIYFQQTEKGAVIAVDDCFIDTDNKKYDWLLDLKDSHAQKIANEFAAKLSRVGIDESEWLRRS